MLLTLSFLFAKIDYFGAIKFVGVAIAVAVIGFALLGATIACFDKRPVDLTQLMTLEQYENAIGADPGDVHPMSEDEFLSIDAPTPQDVSGMVWGFMRTVCERGEAFTEGTFVFEGENGQAIYDKLLSINGVYERESSHYKDRIQVSMGLDVPDEYMMPANKRTILFGLADTQDGHKTFFIKPENYGADLRGSFDSWDKAAHCFHHTREFIFAQYVKIMRPGYDDLPGTAKERIPHEWSVGSIFGWGSLTDEQKQDLVDRGLAKNEWLQDPYRTGREVYIKL